MLISRSHTSTNPNSTDRSVAAHPSVHLGMGANLFDGECSFRVWAPNAIGVSVSIWRKEIRSNRNSSNKITSLFLANDLTSQLKIYPIKKVSDANCNRL
jgi:1,4-alpha-glucan branching enzyme